MSLGSRDSCTGKLAFNLVNNIPFSTSIRELVDIPVKPLKETVIVGRPAVKCEVQ